MIFVVTFSDSTQKEEEGCGEEGDEQRKEVGFKNRPKKEDRKRRIKQRCWL